MLIEKIGNFEEIHYIKNEWNQLVFLSKGRNIFLTYEWFYSWWKCFSEGKNLEIFLIRNDDKNLIGIAPMMKKDKIIKLIGSQEVSDYTDFIIANQKEKIFFRFFLKYLKEKRSEIENLELINVRDSSPTVQALPLIASDYNINCILKEIEVAPFLYLPSSYEEYLAKLSNKNRHELKRKLKRIESLDDLKIKKINNLKELRNSIDDFISLHKKSSPEKALFWNERTYCFFKEICNQFSPNKWIELYFLIYKDKIISSLLIFSYSENLYFFNSAYDKEFSWYSPGLYLFNYCIRQAILDKKIKIDFLRGGEKYKYNFGAEKSNLYKLNLKLKNNQK